MDYTENLSLKKPAQQDYYNVDDFNENADIIDKKIAEGFKNIIDLTGNFPLVQAASGTTFVAGQPAFAALMGGNIIIKGKMAFKDISETTINFEEFVIYFDDYDAAEYLKAAAMLDSDNGIIGMAGYIIQNDSPSPVYAVMRENAVAFKCSFSNESDCYYDIVMPTLKERDI